MMKFTTLAEWLVWLEHNHPREIDLGLERIQQVAARLDLLKPAATVITVAGTNGKGSCVTASAALLSAAGHSVGVYTSPHLLRYAERIQVNGRPVSDDLICDAFQKIYMAAQDISLTYFEYGTLAALEIFKQQRVDFMVLEVGLGGRLDAVNIIDADVAVITSIAIDHQEWLGGTRELIGAEKAGILRNKTASGAKQGFVCADDNPPESILLRAASLNTDSFFIGTDFGYVAPAQSSAESKTWQWFGHSSQRNLIQLPIMRAPHLPLPSLAAAIQVMQLLSVSLSNAQIEHTLLQLQLAGRFQRCQLRGREVILDVAHNPAATQYFAGRLTESPASGKTVAIVAMMSDKDRVASLANLINSVDEWYLLELAHLPRAASVEQLTQDLTQLGAKVIGNGAIAAVVEQVLSRTEADDRIIIFGSFFTVAAALDFLQSESHSSRGLQ